jgi:hypothetical protein
MKRMNKMRKKIMPIQLLKNMKMMRMKNRRKT